MTNRTSFFFSLIYFIAGFFLGVGYHALQQRMIFDAFVDLIEPTIGFLSHYPEVSDDFLVADLSSIESTWYKHPESYRSYLLEQFTGALADYHILHPWELPLLESPVSIVNKMSLEEKVQQLFVWGIDGTTLGQDEETFLGSFAPGGIILMGDNISDGLSGFVKSIQATQSTLPLLIAIDQEGGPVVRIDENLPGQSGLSINNTCRVYRDRGLLLAHKGITLNFGIVADVTKDQTSFIYPRVFADDVVEQVATAIECTESTLSTLKHFPGHGGTSLDTHQGFAHIEYEHDIWKAQDLPPFVAGIDMGADVVMMGHLVADFLGDSFPGTLSPSQHKYVRQLGFTGLIVTDDMLMIDDDYDRYEALKLSLIAGNDLILYVDLSLEERKKIVSTALDLIANQSLIGQDDLDERLVRIVSKKQKIMRWGRHVDVNCLNTFLCDATSTKE